MPTQLLIALVAGGFVLLMGILVMIARFYRKVDQGTALLINKMKAEPEITFSGGVVLPIFHRAEIMDISVKTIEIHRAGFEGLICRDNIRADIKVAFFLRVNKTREDVLRVAQAIGCARASDHGTLELLFAAKFSEALKTVGKKLDFEMLYEERDNFKDQIISVIGKDLNGYVLDDAAIDYLEQTPLDKMDPDNILDARGIQKITDITTQAAVSTNNLKQKQRMELGSQDLAADEAIYRFDQQRADAEAKRDKEIAMSQARESNDALRVQLEEQKLSEIKKQKVEEEVRLADVAKGRAIAVAEQASLREVGVEQVRVTKATDLEQVDRQREVALRSIDKDKLVEVEKKEIANIVAGRIAVEKGVATEEENISDIRAHAGAERSKKVKIIAAEADAQEVLIKDIKMAEAQEQVATLTAKQQLTLAEAALAVADKDARSKIRLAEGVQAEEAAKGLAEVRVKEADANAVEKQGIAHVKVRQAAIEATQREGLVEAEIIREKHLAEATGAEQRGMAEVRVKTADADALEKHGMAEAVGIREKLLAEVTAKLADANATEAQMLAEAKGLAEKAASMTLIAGETREHEEFRLKLEKDVELAMEALKAKVLMSKQHAEVMGEAFKTADINIVGGDGAFFDKFVKSVAVGHSIDGAIDSSSTLQAVLGDRLNGDGDLINDLKEMLASAAAGSDSIKDLSVAAMLSSVMKGADDGSKPKIKALLDKANELGIGNIAPNNK